MFLPALCLAPSDLEPPTRDCPVCRRDSTSLVDRVGRYAYRRCPRCGLVFLTPRPRADVIAERYRTTPLEPPEANRDHMQPIYERALAMLDIGHRTLDPSFGGRLLDIGCGWGHFVARARDRGWDARGVELGDPAADYARRRHGLELLRAMPEGETFDAVTLFFVLEHVPDPVAFLARARSVLAPGGVVACVTPWTSPLVRPARLVAPRANLWETPWHLADFPPGALRRVFARAGLEVVRIGPAGPPGHLRGAARSAAGLVDAAARIASRFTRGRLLPPGLSLLTRARSS